MLSKVTVRFQSATHAIIIKIIESIGLNPAVITLL